VQEIAFSVRVNCMAEEVETWRPVVGYEGYYEVSDLGRVKSLARVVTMKNGCNRPVKERILKPDKSGHYPRVYLEGRGREIHRLVAEAFLGPCPSGQECRHHLDGIPSDPRLRNDKGEIRLEWGTHHQNMQDAIRHGTMPRGETHGTSKLTEEQAQEIINSPLDGKTLARIYDVSDDLPCAIRRGEIWTHIPRQPDRSYEFCLNGSKHPHAKLTETAAIDILTSP
jgi:NUMOD4 motif/HNH endonuclease